MSTKIYYAYKFNGKVQELVPEFRKLREELLKDLPTIKIPKKCSGNKHGQLIRYAKDDEFDIVTYFHKKDIYIQLFCGYGMMDRAVKFLGKKITDFHYQDQVDSENTEKEDAERKVIWEEIFIDYLSPAKVGLSYKVIEHYDILKY